MVRADDETLMKRGGLQESMWTESIAVGSEQFMEWTEEVPGRKAKGRNLVEKEKIFHLGEHAVPNKANLGIKNDDIGGETSSFWKDSSFISN